MTLEDESAAALEPDSLRQLGRNTAILTLAATVGQVLGVIRELFVASRVGASPELDGLLIALVPPTMFAGLLASGSAAALAPTYMEMVTTRSRTAALRFVATIMSWTAAIGIALVVILIGLAGPVVSIAGPGLDPIGRATALTYVPLLAPILVFMSISGLVTVVLQIESRFRAIAVAWLVGPLISLLVTVLLWDSLRLTAFALGLVLNAGATLLFLLGFAWRGGLLVRPALRASGHELVGFARHAAPLTVSASVLQFNLLADRAIASVIGVGAVSVLRYGESIIKLPLNTVSPAWSQVIYPSLVRLTRSDTEDRMGEAAHRSMRYVIALFVPLSVATAALAPLIVQVAYQRGAFTEADTAATAGVLAGFAGLIALTMIQAILVGAHNSRRRGVLLMSMGFTNAILNLIFDVVFGSLFGAAGVALSTSLTVAMVLVVMAWRLDRTEQAFGGRSIVGLLLRAILASTIAAFPVALVAWGGMTFSFLVALGLLVLLTAVGLAIYLAVARWMGVTEPLTVVRAVLIGATNRLRTR